jgi:hypothetical protein
MGRSPSTSLAVTMPRTSPDSSTTKSARTPRAIIVWWASSTLAAAAVVTALTLLRSVITSVAGEFACTRSAAVGLCRRYMTPGRAFDWRSGR